MKKDLFSRAARMTHRFKGLESDDALGGQTFNPQFPKALTTHSSKPLTAKNHGVHRYCEPLSPVVSPSGRRASTNGPAPDYADMAVAQVPVNSKKRKA